MGRGKSSVDSSTSAPFFGYLPLLTASQDLVQKYFELERRYKNACMDLQSEIEARRLLQERDESSKHEYDALKASLVGTGLLLISLGKSLQKNTGPPFLCSGFDRR